MTGISSSCGACKFLRRKCTKECVFAPYFRYEEGAIHFAAIHKVFGASNVSRLLLYLPEQHRSEAAFSIAYEALARMHDPVYGCVAYIYALQQQVTNLQEEIDVLGNQMANLETGVASEYCEILQANSYGPVNNLSHFMEEAPMNPLDYSNIQHQHYANILVDEGEYWDVMNINYEQEAVVPIYEENGLCSNQDLSNETSIVLPQSIPLGDWEGQNLSDYDFSSNYHDKVLNDVLNKELFS